MAYSMHRFRIEIAFQFVKTTSCPLHCRSLRVSPDLPLTRDLPRVISDLLALPPSCNNGVKPLDIQFACKCAYRDHFPIGHELREGGRVARPSNANKTPGDRPRVHNCANMNEHKERDSCLGVWPFILVVDSPLEMRRDDCRPILCRQG
jgi:hypothetical protein